MGGWVASLPSVCVRSGVEGGWSLVVSERRRERVKERGAQRREKLSQFGLYVLLLNIGFRIFSSQTSL